MIDDCWHQRPIFAIPEKTYSGNRLYIVAYFGKLLYKKCYLVNLFLICMRVAGWLPCYKHHVVCSDMHSHVFVYYERITHCLYHARSRVECIQKTEVQRIIFYTVGQIEDALLSDVVDSTRSFLMLPGFGGYGLGGIKGCSAPWVKFS